MNIDAILAGLALEIGELRLRLDQAEQSAKDYEQRAKDLSEANDILGQQITALQQEDHADGE